MESLEKMGFFVILKECCAKVKIETAADLHRKLIENGYPLDSSTIRRYLNGTNLPGTETFEKICVLLKENRLSQQDLTLLENAYLKESDKKYEKIEDSVQENITLSEIPQKISSDIVGRG